MPVALVAPPRNPIPPIPQERLNEITCRLGVTAEALDRSAAFPHQNFTYLAAEGLVGLTVATDFGGRGAGTAESLRVLAAVAKGEPSTALILFMTYGYHAGLTRARAWPATVWRIDDPRGAPSSVLEPSVDRGDREVFLLRSVPLDVVGSVLRCVNAEFELARRGQRDRHLDVLRIAAVPSLVGFGCALFGSLPPLLFSASQLLDNGVPCSIRDQGTHCALLPDGLFGQGAGAHGVEGED